MCIECKQITKIRNLKILFDFSSTMEPEEEIIVQDIEDQLKNSFVNGTDLKNLSRALLKFKQELNELLSSTSKAFGVSQELILRYHSKVEIRPVKNTEKTETSFSSYSASPKMMITSNRISIQPSRLEQASLPSPTNYKDDFLIHNKAAAQPTTRNISSKSIESPRIIKLPSSIVCSRVVPSQKPALPAIPIEYEVNQQTEPNSLDCEFEEPEFIEEEEDDMIVEDGTDEIEVIQQIDDDVIEQHQEFSTSIPLPAPPQSNPIKLTVLNSLEVLESSSKSNRKPNRTTNKKSKKSPKKSGASNSLVQTIIRLTPKSIQDDPKFDITKLSRAVDSILKGEGSLAGVASFYAVDKSILKQVYKIIKPQLKKC